MDLLSILKALGALAFVLGLLLGGTYLLRKYGSRIGLKTGVVSQDLRVVEWRALDMRRKLKELTKLAPVVKASGAKVD